MIFCFSPQRAGVQDRDPITKLIIGALLVSVCPSHWQLNQFNYEDRKKLNGTISEASRQGEQHRTAYFKQFRVEKRLSEAHLAAGRSRATYIATATTLLRQHH